MSSLARMLSLSEGDGGTTSNVSVLPGSDSPEKTSEPIGSLGSLAEQQLTTPSFRNMRPQDREEWQKATRCPASPKKGELDQVDDMRIHENVFAKLLEDMVNRVLGASIVENRQHHVRDPLLYIGQACSHLIDYQSTLIQPTSLLSSTASVPAAVSLDHAQADRSEVRDNTREVRIELMRLVETVMRNENRVACLLNDGILVYYNSGEEGAIYAARR